MANKYNKITKSYFEESTPQNAKAASAQIGAGAHGTIDIVSDFVGTEGNDYSIIVDDSNSGSDDVDTTVDLTDGVITVFLGTDGDTDSTATIGLGADGQVIVTVDPTGVDENTYTIEVVEGADGAPLAASLVAPAITVTLGMETAAVSTSSIGSGAHGTVNLASATTGLDKNDLTIEVELGTADGENLSASYVGDDIVVTLGNDDGDAAISSIGTGADGTVDLEIDANGSGGNAYTVAVDATLAVQDRALGATLVGTDLVVALATEGSVAASSSIGSGANGVVNITVDAVGSDGNDYTVAVDASLATQRNLSANLVVKDITVNLATEGLAKAISQIGSGADGTVDIEVNAAGTNGNDYNIEVVEGVGINVALSSVLVGNDITVTLGTTDELNAAAQIGSGGDGTVDVYVNTAGVAGNSYSIEVVEGIGENAPLTVLFTGTELTITLGTDGAGALDAAKNTAGLIATAITGATFTAVATGTGLTALSAAELEAPFTGGNDGGDISTPKNTSNNVAIAITNIAGALFTATASGFGTDPLLTAEAIKDFTGGTNQLKAVSNTATLVTAEVHGLAGISASATGDGSTALTIAELEKNFINGTNQLKTASNTAGLVATEINNSTAGITATATGTGLTSLTLTEAEKNFTGGGANFALDPVKNTATNVAGVITAAVGGDIIATPTGTGLTALTIAEAQKNFTGGQSTVPSPTKNTATLVAGVVTVLAGINAVKTGTGATPLLVAEAPKTFSGGTDTGTISSIKNTAIIIAGLITAAGDITATATGTGATPLLSAEVSQDFTGGQYATEAKSQVYMIISGTWYLTKAPVSKWSTNGWYSGSQVLL